MNAHTPGPWYLDAHDEKGWFLLSESGPDIMAEPFDCADADARLIAAAPDMFDALQAIVDAYGDRDTLLLAQCKAALAKAKGVES
jgi:hypothetical protein